MSAKYQVSKQYSRLTGENQWTLTCYECGRKMWAHDWKHAIFLASYPCDNCKLWETVEGVISEKAKQLGNPNA